MNNAMQSMTDSALLAFGLFFGFWSFGSRATRATSANLSFLYDRSRLLRCRLSSFVVVVVVVGCGLWFVVCGLWFVVCGLSSLSS